MSTAKTYQAMIAGSRFEFSNGTEVRFVGERGQTGSYTTEDPEEQAQLDKVAKIPGSGISAGEARTAKAASSGIAAEILAKTQAATAAVNK